MSAGHGSPAPAGGSLFAPAVELLRRRAAVAGGAAAVVLIAAAAVVLLARPVYRAEARLKIGEPPPTAGVSPTGGLLNFLRTGGDPFANDVEVLASRTLAEAVVRDAALAVTLKAPRGWYRDSLFTAFELQDTTIKAVFEATWAQGSVHVRQRAPEGRDVGTFAVGEPAVFGGLRIVFAPRRPGGPVSVRLRTVPFDEAVRITAQRLKVTRTRRDANVLEITYSRDEPDVAARVVDSAVRRFLELRIRLFETESSETVDSLRTVAAGTRADLTEAEDSLESVQRRSGLVAPDEQSEALIARYETAFAALEAARAERDALDAQAMRVGDAAGDVQAWAMQVAHPRFLENSTVGALLERLTALAERRTELLSLRRPTSVDARTLDAEIAQLADGLAALVAEYRLALGERIDVLDGRVRELDRVIARLPSDIVELGRRQRAVRILSEILVVTEQRLRQEELRQALAFSNVQVIDPPRLRWRPVWPRKKLGLAVGAFLALGAGLFTAVVAERADPTLRRATRARELAGAPVLASPIGGAALTVREREALAERTGERCALAVCDGAEADARRLVADPGGMAFESVESVDGYAAAAALVRTGAPLVVVVRVGATTEQELARVAALVREAGGEVHGVVAACAGAREAGALWG